MLKINTVTMEDKIEKILKNSYSNFGEFDESKAAKELLDLFSVINWVSVKDKLPPNENKRYLTYKNNEMVFQNWYYVNGSGYWYDYLGVTHWCEIPKPPCL